MAEEVSRVLLVIILAAQAAAAVIAFWMDYHYPFSNAEKVADFISRNNLAGNLLVGYRDFTSSGVAAYLRAPLYYPTSHRFGTFIRWDNRRKETNIADVLEQTAMLIRGRDPVYLLLDSQVVGRQKIYRYRSIHTGEQFLFDEVFSTNGAIVKDEDFSLYRVMRE